MCGGLCVCMGRGALLSVSVLVWLAARAEEDGRALWLGRRRAQADRCLGRVLKGRARAQSSFSERAVIPRWH